MPPQSEMLLRAILALGLGNAIGMEREWRGHDAGTKTHALVALGTALFANI